MLGCWTVALPQEVPPAGVSFRERYLTAAVRLLFRADAAFAKPEIYEYLEARNIGYAIRLRSNQVLQREIAHRLIRPTEWLSPKPIVSYHDFVY